MRNYLTEKRLLLLKKEYSKMPEGSLNIKSHKGYYSFYHYNNSQQVTISRNQNLIYRLARKKYLSFVINNRPTADIQVLLDKFLKSGLDLQRITLTPAQYRWVKSDYPKNTGWQENLKYVTDSGVNVRSKSERDIGNELEHYAVPYRYDMLCYVDVSAVIDGLRDYLTKHKYWRYNNRTLYTYRDGYCVWNVPEELKWMNAPGSIWRSYDYRSNTITISVDFSIMLGDGSILLWEHAGLCLNPIYRCNISERIFVLQTSNYVPSSNILFTTENEILDLTDIDRLIEEKILPRL